MQLYSQILDHAGHAFGAVLRHIRDKPEQGCLFHCTGTHAVVPPVVTGWLIACPIRSWQRQDRRPGRITIESMQSPSSRLHASSSSEGQLAGVDDDAIARDYALTRVGREPAREMVMRRLSLVPFFASNTEGALNMLSSRYVRPAIPAVRHTHDASVDTKQ